MPVPLLDLEIHHAPLREAIRAAIDEVVAANAFILGKATDRFEAALARYCGVEHAIGCSSGTDALLLALMAYDIGAGDEVIVPAFTFFATAGAVSRVGATPVFVDIDPVTFNIDPASAERAISGRTRAIIPVHLFGQCADMGAMMRLAGEHELIVIEDAAQAIGARYDDAPAGSIGHVNALSFYPTKNLGAFGDAGALLIPHDAELAAKSRRLRLHGQADTYHHTEVGGNFRIDGIQSAVLNVKLAHLDAYAAGRRRAAGRYDALLAGTPLTLPTTAPGRHHVFNQYTVRVPDGKRDALGAHLSKHGIGNRVYYPLGLHLQPCFADLGGAPGDLPETERATAEVISLPMFPEITEQQQAEVASLVRAFLG